MRSLTVSGTLTVVGDRPLILAVYGDATIDGGVRANGSGATPGPGSVPSVCGAGLGGLGGTYQQGNQNGGGGGVVAASVPPGRWVAEARTRTELAELEAPPQGSAAWQSSPRCEVAAPAAGAAPG
jgi:hypothetical protein